jgi:1-acyl-sn-glycerol-3-phosphate acyltransferase
MAITTATATTTASAVKRQRLAMSNHGHLATDRDLWLRRLFPLLRSMVRARYFSLEVEGLENVPRDGHVVFAPNHAGWFALDAAMLGLAVTDGLGAARLPWFAAADAVFETPVLGAFFERLGALPATWFRRPEKLPAEIESCAVFPEGVRGNTKPFWEAYRMREWSRGFVRVAAARDATIVPTAILGGEECLPVAWTVRLLEPMVGSVFGLPLSLVPLPVRWKVAFLPPVRLEVRGRHALMDAAYCGEVARAVQRTVQTALDRESARYPLARLSGGVAALHAMRHTARQAR